MKRLINLFILTILVSAMFSCEKYGHEFENGYQIGDTTGSDLPDGPGNRADQSLYHRARVFPGLVGPSVHRAMDTTITMHMAFENYTAQQYKVQAVPLPIFSTGLYAPAGETISIEVPEGVIGLTVQVGAHQDNLSGLLARRRDPVIYTRVELFPGINYVKNLYGGIVWIRSNNSQDAPVNLTFSGVVRTADFVLGESTVDSWINDVTVHDVPWLELRGKRTIFTVPRTTVLRFIGQGRLRDIDQALAEWDLIYERDYYDWMGLEPNASDEIDNYPVLPERAVMDIHPVAGYAHSGMPWVMQLDDYWFDELTSLNTIREGRSWGSYHETGHNYQQTLAWSWSDLGETTNNLFIFNGGRNRGNTSIVGFHSALQNAFTTAMEYVTSNESKNFSNLSDWIGDGEVPFFRLTPFLQIFNKVEGRNGESGWDFMPFIYTNARHMGRVNTLDQAKRDYFYRQLCEFTGLDFQRFFSAWGIPISAIARREMRQRYDPMDQAVWTYNPLTREGGDQAIGTKYDLNNSLFEYSSNMPVQEGDGIGFAALNSGTYGDYFHSCWSCNPPASLPTTITMDLGDLEAFKGLYYGNRNHAMTNKRMTIHYSVDNQTWIEIGDYDDLPDNRAVRNEIEFAELIEAQYVRVTFSENNRSGNPYVSLSELGLFYDN